MLHGLLKLLRKFFFKVLEQDCNSISYSVLIIYQGFNIKKVKILCEMKNLSIKSPSERLHFRLFGKILNTVVEDTYSLAPILGVIYDVSGI